MSRGRVSFRVVLPQEQTSYINFPVEVRRPNMLLVARTVCSESIELEPGSYIVTTTLPGGISLLSEVEVKDGSDTTIHLAPDPSVPTAASPYDWRGVANGVGTVGPSDEPDPISPDLPPPPAPTPLPRLEKVRLLSGNTLQGEWRASTPTDWTLTEESAGRLQCQVYGNNAPEVAQLLQPYQPALNVALPAWGGDACLLSLIRLPSGIFTLEVQVANEDAEVLLRYRAHGYLTQAATMANSASLTAERLLMRKQADPIAATVGAYALLRFNELDRLHDWTENLKNHFTWLPDALVLRAEHLARLGEHAQALELLLELPERGLPYFSDGLSYAVDRLRLYLGSGSKQLEPTQTAQIAPLLEALQRVASVTDFQKPVLTFTGLDPARPDDAPLDLATLRATDGLTLSTRFD